MATRLIWARILRDVICGGRQLSANQVLELTPEEFKALAAERAAVPCGPNGRMLTSDHHAVDMKLGRAAR